MKDYDELIKKIDDFISYLYDFKQELLNGIKEKGQREFLLKENKPANSFKNKDFNSNFSSSEKSFYNFLVSRKKLKSVTANQYIQALKTLTDIANNELNYNSNRQIVDINNYDLIASLINKFKDNETFVYLNMKRHNLYSAAINNFYKFLS